MKPQIFHILIFKSIEEMIDWGFMAFLLILSVGERKMKMGVVGDVCFYGLRMQL